MEKKAVIDVSHWDGLVDYNAWINKHNLWGVIIKAGGNETSLGRYTDSQFETNYQKARAANLHIGAYYYTVVTSIEEAKKDAQHLIGLLKDHNFDMPIYMDVEDPRQFKLSKRLLTDIIKTFCDALNKAGYYAGLYMSGSTWLNNVVTDELRSYANWIAWWRANWPNEAGDIGLWQQGTKRLRDGKVYYDDVSGCTDFNWCIIDYPSYIKNNSTKQKTTNKKDALNKLKIDGVGGATTIKAWQAALGTTQDGVISGQFYKEWKYFSGIQSVTWEKTGSELVKAVQRKVGAKVDGYWGPNTSKAIQKFLIKKGFNVGPEGADGYFGTNSVKGLQNSLNSEQNPWK